MADSDSISLISSQSGDDDSRLRSHSTVPDMTNKSNNDRPITAKSKSANDGVPEIGSSYMVRRQDDTHRKWTGDSQS